MPYNPRTEIEQAFQQDTGLPGSALPPGPGYVLNPNGKIVVGNDTYYPSTTGGKLDLFSKTIAAESVPVTPSVRSGASSPYAVIEQQSNTLRQRFAEQAQRMRRTGMPPEQYNKLLVGLQADYDKENYKLADVRTQLNGIQSAIDSGIVDPTLGQQTQWKIAAPHMAGAFKMAQEPRGRMTPGEMTALGKKFAGSRDRAYVAPWMSSNYYDPEKLKQEYLTDRATYGYDDQMNTSEKQAFDIQWDAVIAAKPAADKVWKGLLANDPELMASRPYGSQLLGVAGQKVTGKRISPFEQGVNSTPQNPTNLQPVVYAKNKQTGQRIQSVDGGKTWQIAR
jgi:hypothetical protein